jgi:hypothetical protein
VDDAREILDSYLGGLEGEVRRLAPGEWGVTLEAAGRPLHLGIAVRDGLVRAQAAVAPPGRLAPEDLLRWNRSLPLVRFGQTRAGEVWIHGDLPFAAVGAEALDRFLGLLVLAATQAREAEA